MKRSPRLAVLFLALAMWAPSPAQAVTDRLPDLSMARLRNFSITTAAGQRQLRFTTIIVNTGVGPFQTTGSRNATSDSEMDNVTQRIFDDAGGHRDVQTTATMFFAGDGHLHWHVRDLESYELTRLSNGNTVGTGEKHGFCFYDSYEYRLGLPGAPQSPVYTGCGGPNDLSVTTGLSVGWGDRYNARIPDQFIDITGLSTGTYRLTATADEANWFVESNDGNNRTCVILRISSSAVSVVRYTCS
jgi:hypothetical protein